MVGWGQSAGAVGVPELARVVFVLAGAALLVAGCRSVEGTRGIPPLFEVYDTPSSVGLPAEAEGREFVLRPLGSYESAAPDRRRLRALLPFIDFGWSGEERRFQIVPLFRHHARRKLLGGVDSDTMLFPLFFWGRDDERGSYFAFFPFAGEIRGLLGIEVGHFVLFPLWFRGYRDGRTSTHILWPFGNTVSGGGWSGGRVWPFYGSYRWNTEDGQPRSRRWFVMWPFWIRQQEWLHRDPTDIVFVFPFYGRRENSRSLTRTWLWPFYVQHLDKRSGEVLHGGYAFPYRFGPNQFDPWPFFGLKWKEPSPEDGIGLERRRTRQFALWPIQRYDWAEDRLYVTERMWILPFWWDFEKVRKSTGESSRRWTLWPLASWRRHGEDARFETFSILWFDREDYRRFYGRLFAWFRWRSRPTKTAWELLWGTVYWESGEDRVLFSLLGGLVEAGRESDGGWIARLLWVPWW